MMGDNDRSGISTGDQSAAFAALPKGHYGAIYADPPWRFNVWGGTKGVQARGSKYKPASVHYQTMAIDELAALPVKDLAADDCCLFMWACWPTLLDAIALIEAWGFKYKTCAFDWMKAHAGQVEMFRDDTDALMGMGYWTRANSEPCLLATRGKPKRANADVRQGIIEPRREHSRKPDCIYERIERLVTGPYLELFARTQRPGWDVWGNQTDKFTTPTIYDGQDDFAKSLDVGYAAIRERVAAGGPGWQQSPAPGSPVTEKPSNEEAVVPK